MYGEKLEIFLMKELKLICMVISDQLHDITWKLSIAAESESKQMFSPMG